MSKEQNWWRVFVVMFTAVTAALVLTACHGTSDEWGMLESKTQVPSIAIEHPIEGAQMPSNMPAPVLFWNENDCGDVIWICGIKAGQKKWLWKNVFPMWRLPKDRWEEVKRVAGAAPVEIILAACQNKGAMSLVRRSVVHFTVNGSELKDSLFYREVNLPFVDAVKDPSKIRWRFGSINKESAPPIVLQNLPVCGNCHSFSRNGEFLAMDVDYANSKASYVITRTAPEMHLTTSDIITWDDYRREDGKLTFGLLSQISPDGRYVLSTVKDRSVFVPRPNLAFSQLFFPLKGIVAVYDRETKQFHELPGADDPVYVQSNPTWSPDGKWVVFARNKAAELKKTRDTGSILLTAEECEDFVVKGKEFRFDLYRVPFNDGKGGKAEPLKGASANGKSNFFPKYSPDGRWIVFCQASNYMLLQPDSRLYIIPSEGGQARPLKCNLGRMNSWHSWSSDGQWLVFSSKAHSDYTQLYLTHINKDGEATPAVWLSHLVSGHMAANIPEFVNLKSDAILHIHEKFLDDYSFTRAGNEFFRAGDADNAIEKYLKALSLNPKNVTAHQVLGFLLFRVKKDPSGAMDHLKTALQLEPKNGLAQFDLGVVLAATGDLTNAEMHLDEATRLLPNGYNRIYNMTDMNYALAETRYRLGHFADCIAPLEIVTKHGTAHPRGCFLMAMARAWQGETDTAVPYFLLAAKLDDHLAQLPDFYDLLSRNYVDQKCYQKGLEAAEKGEILAEKAGREDQSARLHGRAAFCRTQL